MRTHFLYDNLNIGVGALNGLLFFFVLRLVQQGRRCRCRAKATSMSISGIIWDFLSSFGISFLFGYPHLSYRYLMSLLILLRLEGCDLGDGNFGFESVFEPFVGVTFLFVVVAVSDTKSGIISSCLQQIKAYASSAHISGLSASRVLK